MYPAAVAVTPGTLRNAASMPQKQPAPKDAVFTSLTHPVMQPSCTHLALPEQKDSRNGQGKRDFLPVTSIAVLPRERPGFSPDPADCSEHPAQVSESGQEMLLFIAECPQESANSLSLHCHFVYMKRLYRSEKERMPGGVCGGRVSISMSVRLSSGRSLRSLPSFPWAWVPSFRNSPGESAAQTTVTDG